MIFTAVAIGSLLAGVLLHTIGWATMNLLLLPLVLATAIATWRWRRPHLPDPQLASVDAT